MPRAIVVGGGIGGLCAALALRRAGIDTRVFEREARGGELGAGLTLWPNAMTALRVLGLDRTVAAIGAPLTGAIRSWRGSWLAVPEPGAIERRLGAPVLAVHRAALRDVLLDRLEPGTLVPGARCVGFEQGPGGVTVAFADGRAERADLLVGADGVNSEVRSALLGDGPPRHAGYVAWRAVAPVAPAGLRAAESWGPAAVFGVVPLLGGRTYWYATKPAPADRAHPPSARKPELRARFAAWHDPIPGLIEATEAQAILCHDVVDREPIERFGHGRVTLLGDAAHPMTPHLGQGACQAIEDAVVLAACLARPIAAMRAASPAAGGERGALDVPAALRAYGDRRAARTAAIVRRSRHIGRISQLRRPRTRALRDVLVRLTPTRVQLRQLDALLAVPPEWAHG